MNGIEVALQGRVGSDPEVKTAKSGKQYAKFTVAVGEGETVQWVQVAAFDKQVERVATTVRKGSVVYVEGRLKLDRWQKNGAERSGLSVAAWLVRALGQIGERKRNGGHGGDRHHEDTGNAAAVAARDDALSFDRPTDEIPF